MTYLLKKKQSKNFQINEAGNEHPHYEHDQ